MPRRIPHSKAKIRLTVEKHRNIKVCAALLGCSVAGLYRHLERADRVWWHECRDRWRRSAHARRKRATYHRRKAREILAAIDADPGVWHTLTARQQGWVSDYRAGLLTPGTFPAHGTGSNV